eukprot:GEMP01048589.1.p1 GENE.GEMP01048589.1~~GEMP01048589.1.p1  ORF type:complete len:294 (+),score=48.38 GEMP01048589.1:101-982(+)
MVMKRHVLFATASAAASFWFIRRIQTKMLYHPRPYSHEYNGLQDSMRISLQRFKFHFDEISFQTPKSEQKPDRAFVFAPKKPTRLWILYGGNAMLGLDFSDLLLHSISTMDQSDNAFLLMDFPGFGHSELSTTPGNTLNNSLAALKAVEEKFGPLEVNGFGHSLGCAAILQLAAEVPLKNVVLSAPFLSIADMALSVFPFLKVMPRFSLLPLVQHNWDNAHNLPIALSKQDSSGTLTIVHGENDEIVPFAHGEQLASMSPRITFHRSTAGHNDILGREIDLFAQLFQGKSSKL